MQGKMGDTNLRYFIAISENKRKDMELRNLENKIDGLQKKMLTRYWKEKISVFDDMIRLNVKTPSYDSERATSALGKADGADDGSQSMAMGAISIDTKLLSNRPVTLQKGNKGMGRIEPIINIEGTDAVCYPNKEAKRGRKVGLNLGVLRRLEQCRVLEENIASIRCKSASRRDASSTEIRRSASVISRPKTAPGKTSDKGKKRPETSRTEKTTDSDQIRDSLERRPSTSIGSFKREGFITASTERRRPSTSGSARSRVSWKSPS